MSDSHSTERKCGFPGCEKSHDAKGLCKSHGKQLRKGKKLTPLFLTVRPKGSLPRIEYRESPCLVPGLIGPCHEWTGSKIKAGYGQVSLNGKPVRVHRYVWELVNGSIAEGMVMDHKCRNRACCNVDHLRVVTRKVNNTENILGAGWQLNAAKTHCKNGHQFDQANTRIGKKGTRVCRTCESWQYRKMKAKVRQCE